MSTTFVIGRWPAAVRRALSHSGDGPIVDVLEHARGEARAQVGASTSTRTSAASTGACPGRRPTAAAQRRAGGGVDLARDAVDAEAVGPVGRDLELEHVGRDRQHLGQRRARRRAPSASTMIPAWSAPMRELVLGEDHPLGLDAAQLGLPELRAAGHDRAGPRDRDRLAGGDVRRAAHDLGGSPSPTSTRADAEAVGVGVLLGVEHLADDEAVERLHAGVVDALDLGAGHRQPLAELARPASPGRQ